MQRSSHYGKASPSGYTHVTVPTSNGQEMGRGAEKIVKSWNGMMSAVKQAFPEVAK